MFSLAFLLMGKEGNGLKVLLDQSTFDHTAYNNLVYLVFTNQCSIILLELALATTGTIPVFKSVHFVLKSFDHWCLFFTLLKS